MRSSSFLLIERRPIRLTRTLIHRACTAQHSNGAIPRICLMVEFIGRIGQRSPTIPIYLIAAGLTGVGLAFCLAVAVKSFWNERADYVRTRSTAISRHPERTGIAGLAEISFSCADRLHLAGWYAPSRNR